MPNHDNNLPRNDLNVFNKYEDRKMISTDNFAINTWGL